MSTDRHLVAARTHQPDYAAFVGRARAERSQALRAILSALGRGLVTLVAARFAAPTAHDFVTNSARFRPQTGTNSAPDGWQTGRRS